eukprot:SAG31_NODE_3912_length_3756_cov_2.368205_3_plen_136_part_00
MQYLCSEAQARQQNRSHVSLVALANVAIGLGFDKFENGGGQLGAVWLLKRTHNISSTDAHSSGRFSTAVMVPKRFGELRRRHSWSPLHFARRITTHPIRSNRNNLGGEGQHLLHQICVTALKLVNYTADERISCD